MMENLGNQISDLHFGKFPDSSDFQCWKTNFRTEVCSNSGCPTIAMLWIKEMEIAKSVDDLMTSQSIEGRDFPDFEMLDAKIASALERIIANQYFRRRIDVEEQNAQTYDRFLRGRQIAHMIYDHFRATGAHDAALDLSDPSNVSLQGHDIQDFGPRWDQALLSASEIRKENVLESLYKMRIRESVQLQTVLAMYEQEIDRDRAKPSYQRLKTMVKRHTDQPIRMRNFRARNARIETGVSVKCHKGKKVSVERRMGKCYQWKANGQCSRGDSCSFIHGNNRGQRAQSSSPAPKAQTQIDGRKPSKGTWPG